MAAEPSASKKRRLDPETSVKEEISPGANEDTPSRDEQTSGGELEKRSDFWEPFKRLFNSPDHSDVKICVRNSVEFYGHSLVFKIRCPRLAEIQVPAASGKSLISISGDDRAVLRMLEYIYTGDYSVDTSTLFQGWRKSEGKLTRHAKVYSLARNYKLSDLQALCYDKCAKDWNCGSFCQSIFCDLEPTDKDEISFVMDTAVDHADELFRDEAFVNMLAIGRGFNNLSVTAFFTLFAQKLLLKEHTSSGSKSTL